MQPARNGVSLGRVIGPKNEAIKMGCKKEQKKERNRKGKQMRRRQRSMTIKAIRFGEKGGS